MIPLPFYIFIFIELVFVAIIDVKHKKIANLWSLLNVGVATILFIFFSEHYPVSFGAFQYTIVFLLAGFLLFRLKIMGGGDSKFLASFFLIVPFDKQDQVFFQLLIATIIIGVIVFGMNTFANRKKLIESLREKDIEGVKSCFGTKFAYAPVILVTWILFGISMFKKSSSLMS